jgi:hypothetical protein
MANQFDKLGEIPWPLGRASVRASETIEKFTDYEGLDLRDTFECGTPRGREQ